MNEPVPTCAELARRPDSRAYITVHSSGKNGEPTLVTLTPKGQAEIYAAMARNAERSTP